ncbi:class I SAM-dependent methyltransferase (plasmid) [Burkholderia sp. FERM BP-3421]|uniref:class I SAM-dependent methyltransferase n=1 Tax=Burkholderia sp. FERM BP-3421 TaxID=1494466 RepID=UPI002362C0BD|nr:class I SAM-dependent methyltransferase [Burkholderia sp. FERM BP-3421]WDD90458.1 class I SAM-dependent methyltransferase [Burkholderia sp. FERM BP-3421]
MQANDVPWLSNFYDPALFDAGAGESDSIATISHSRAQLAGTEQDVADIGCGTGRIALRLIDDGHRVHGVDTSETMLAPLGRKAERLPRDARDRLDRWHVDVLAPAPPRTFDALITMDDFVSHFDTRSIERFFQVAATWLKPDGVLLLCDLRVRGAPRGGVGGFPETYGLTEGMRTEDGMRHAAMMGWEEYDPANRRLVSHQIYSFIDVDVDVDVDGREAQRVWTTIVQYNHSNALLIDAAERAGFSLESATGRAGETEAGGQGGYFRWRRQRAA